MKQIAIITCVAIFAIACFLLGIAYGQKLMRKEAVLGGFAEYLPDSVGNPKFAWK